MVRARATAPSTLYERDFYEWTQRQSELLRTRDFQALDLDNIAEEIETLGRSEATALRSSLRLILMHMLKLRYQAERATRSWRDTIRRERINVERSLNDNPGLKSRVAGLFRQAYEDAREEASIETGLSVSIFPIDPEFTLEQARDKSFLPSVGPLIEGSGTPESDRD